MCTADVKVDRWTRQLYSCLAGCCDDERIRERQRSPRMQHTTYVTRLIVQVCACLSERSPSSEGGVHTRIRVTASLYWSVAGDW